ncbi:ubiquinol-cytochrome C chaperone family protein [Hyphomicrobium sp.]|uniref:ubiquinol-cytochrome C chaperone family protein n=1 Tax=Hyphomicrobium sp. TaxID=82 RepID=UPI0025BC3C2B|nr:ubiquinol-cytochrome C chaperone family protein [Hyphomicrobium sp.]MCC7250804.1 hypothetical protein [Hyphomicrobium sp.]
MAHARHPVFFARHGVLDTPEGRTAMIILLMFPLLERLQSGGAQERRIARLLTETFITDIDDCLREMGVGDLSVPKKVKRAAQALGERCLAYRRAAASREPMPAVARELAATVPGLDADPEGAEALARLTLKAVADLRAVAAERLLAGAIALPEPADMAALAEPPRGAA